MKGGTTLNHPNTFHPREDLLRAVAVRERENTVSQRSEDSASTLCRRLVTRGLAATFLCLLGLAIRSDAANLALTFDDSTDTVRLQTADTSGRIHAADCPGPSTQFEECVIVVTQPAAGVTISSAHFPFQPTLSTVVIGDADGSTISDLLGYGQCSLLNCSGAGSPSPPAPGVAYSLNFNSDPATEAPFSNLGNLCSAVAGGCPVIETGVEQPAGTVTWSDRSVDTINFVSDAEIPEPPSFFLLLPGFAGLCAARRFRASVPAA